MGDPVVICEDNGERLELGPNPNNSKWLMLAWVGSLLCDEVADACAVGLPREALADLALALLPHLTGDDLRRVAEAMPRVAGEWVTGSHRSGFWRSVGPMRIADVFKPVASDHWTADVLLGVRWEDLGNHPTARAAQAACDARLEAAGVRLCGEQVREEGT